MLHLLLYGLLAILLAGVLFLLATRFLPAGEQIAPALRDEPPWELPPGRLRSMLGITQVRHVQGGAGLATVDATLAA